MTLLPEIVERLRCPVCAAALATRGPALACTAGHSFDLARQGYVSLLAGPAPAVAETPAMVAARSSLLSGRYAPLVAAVAERAAALASTASLGAGLGCVVDVGAGPGHYLAALLDRRAELVGIALDVAKPAARAAARAHPRLNAIVADAWRGLPLRDGAADLLLNVFAPRNGPEFRRILAPHGALLVVTPTADHLAALVRALDLLTVDPAKDARLAEALSPHFELVDERPFDLDLELSRADAGLAVAMGPSAWHADPARLDTLPDPLPTAISVTLRTYHPHPP